MKNTIPFLSEENLMLAYRLAYKTRKHKVEVQDFLQNESGNLRSILSDLRERKYIHAPYRRLIISDSKKRHISSPIFRDHILHHMLHNILYDVLDRRIPFQSFATRKGKWLHSALRYLSWSMEQLPIGKEWYFCKIDVSKYFFSISHDILRDRIFRLVENPDVRYAIDMVLASYITSDMYDHLFHPDSHYRMTPNKGLPIGAIISQLFANFYLSNIDHYIQRVLWPKIYIRYMDDMLFVWNKESIVLYQDAIISYLWTQSQLHVVPKKIVLNTLKHGFTFIGYHLKKEDPQVSISVSRKNKQKFWSFMDKYSLIDISLFSLDDKTRIRSAYESRKSHFIHTGDCKSYFSGCLKEEKS